MPRCSVEIDHPQYGPLRCAGDALAGRRCAVHEGRALAPEPPAVPLEAVGGGCLVLSELADLQRRRRGRRAAEFLDVAGRPVWWVDEVALFVDPVAWLFLQRYGRPRPPGTYQGCRTPGCVAPVHAVEPSPPTGRRFRDIASRLDRRFGWGPAPRVAGR